MILISVVLSFSLRVSPRLVGELFLSFSLAVLFRLCKTLLVLCRGQGDDAGLLTAITQQPPHSDGTGLPMHGCMWLKALKVEKRLSCVHTGNTPCSQVLSC